MSSFPFGSKKSYLISRWLNLSPKTHRTSIRSDSTNTPTKYAGTKLGRLSYWPPFNLSRSFLPAERSLLGRVVIFSAFKRVHLVYNWNWLHFIFHLFDLFKQWGNFLYLYRLITSTSLNNLLFKYHCSWFIWMDIFCEIKIAQLLSNFFSLVPRTSSPGNMQGWNLKAHQGVILTLPFPLNLGSLGENKLYLAEFVPCRKERNFRIVLYVHT